MSTNFYFQAGDHIGRTSEQRLVEDVVIEVIKTMGSDVFYVPRTSVSQDNLFGEDTMARFQQAHALEAYIANVQGWEGDGELMSKFGITVNDQATFVISKRRWEESVALQTDDLQLPKRPAEGDIIFFPKTNSFFEIKYVNHLNPFYQLNKFYVYVLRVELLQYTSEEFDTGRGEIDEWAASQSRDLLRDVLVDQNGDPIHGQTGDWIIHASTPPSPNTVNDTPQIHNESRELVDFSERNPFGEL